MKTWIKRSLIAVTGLALIGGGMAACGHRHHHGFGTMSEADAAQMKAKLVDRVGSKLDLDAAQKAKLATLADKLREQRNALVGGSADPRADLQSLIAGTTFDRSKASALIEGKVAAVNTQSPAVVAAMADFYDSLKPEQQAKVRDYLSQRGHRGGWGHRG
jgi:periplasmic protein CpxP/Spy